MTSCDNLIIAYYIGIKSRFFHRLSQMLLLNAFKQRKQLLPSAPFSSVEQVPPSRQAEREGSAFNNSVFLSSESLGVDDFFVQRVLSLSLRVRGG